MVVPGAWTGGGGCEDIGNVLNHGGSGSDNLWVGVVDHVPVDWEVAERISPSGDTEVDGADATVERGKYLYIPPSPPGGGKNVGGIAGDRNLHCPLPEHCRAIYCNTANCGPVSSSGVASMIAGFESVGGAGEHLFGGDTGVSAGGGGRKGLRVAVGRGYGGRDGKIRQNIM